MFLQKNYLYYQYSVETEKMVYKNGLKNSLNI